MNKIWIKRRYHIVEKEYEYVISHFNEYNICERFETFDEFLDMFGYFLYRQVYDMIYYEEGEFPEGLEETLKELYKDLNWEFVNQGLVDEIIVAVTPYLVGGNKAKTLVEGDGFSKINQSLRLNLRKITRQNNELVLYYN